MFITTSGINFPGVWGAGIAQEIRDIFPAAYGKYKGFCDDFEREPGSAHASGRLAGQCLIIPPQQEDADSGSPAISIVCLFTSYGYGRKTATKPGRYPKRLVREQTTRALEQFRSQLDRGFGINEARVGGAPGGAEGEGVRIYSPKFNSALFKVPWEDTVTHIQETFRGWKGRWVVLVR
ncbi:hypothetical protein DL769_002323 [Monosporascus sp. CRB-8-3]|nr:hypothetical protein DL769_002323 [Monosporascus sp. CRB-8-3]